MLVDGVTEAVAGRRRGQTARKMWRVAYIDTNDDIEVKTGRWVRSNSGRGAVKTEGRKKTSEHNDKRGEQGGRERESSPREIAEINAAAVPKEEGKNGGENRDVVEGELRPTRLASPSR